jgi:hypothetical protein
MHTEFSSENLRGRTNFGDLDVDGRIILKFILVSVFSGIN